jgi:heptosyltransferase-3
MRILFIKLRHIGDSLLLTPTVVATKRAFPDAEIWVLVRRTCDSMLDGCPEVDRILRTAHPDPSRRRLRDRLHDLRLLAKLRLTRFDHVFELTDNNRARVFALAARTAHRCANHHPSLRPPLERRFHVVTRTRRYRQHQVIRDYVCPRDVLGLPEDPPPLRFAPERMRPWPAPAEPFAVAHVHTRWAHKSWPLDRWETLLRSVLEFVPRLVLSCGPGREEVAETRLLRERLGERCLSTDGEASWSQLAWVLSRAAFFVGVDTAAMHLAAAAGCPTVCLFGPSPDFEYHPWKVRHWMIRPQQWLGEEAAAALPRDDLMREIPVSKVLDACREAWSEGRGVNSRP